MATQLNDWLSIDMASDTGNAQITLTASSYSELVDRVASLRIQAQSTNAILNVRQKAFSPVEKNNNYFWIEFENTGGEVDGLGKSWTDIYYSFDANTWTAVDSTGVVSLGTKRLVYLKNETKILSEGYDEVNDVFKHTAIKFNSNAKIGGDLSSMTDMIGDCCVSLFEGNKYLTDASELILPWDTLANNCYYHMFYNCTSLTSAPVLPATTLADDCYTVMFKGCTSLTTAPELPATTLARGCYYHMFEGCTNLTSAPALPATTLADYCYTYMFYNCTSLTSAPVLPATTLGRYCYSGMFYNCTSLTTAPVLPATTLVDSCYMYMFDGCINLTTAPELPATTLANYCYRYMFQGCHKLNYIKMLATVWAKEPLTNWVQDVSSTGTFVKHPDNTSIPIDSVSGIPSGWTVETATS